MAPPAKRIPYFTEYNKQLKFTFMSACSSQMFDIVFLKIICWFALTVGTGYESNTYCTLKQVLGVWITNGHQFSNILIC